MLVIKLIENGKERLYEIRKIGSVGFDPRQNHLLVANPVGDRFQRQTIHWVHPDDVYIIWIRQFNFKEL